MEIHKVVKNDCKDKRCCWCNSGISFVPQGRIQSSAVNLVKSLWLEGGIGIMVSNPSKYLCCTYSVALFLVLVRKASLFSEQWLVQRLKIGSSTKTGF